MILIGNNQGSLVQRTMEKDCMASLGASFMTNDRLHAQSDPYEQWICNICGLPAVHNKYTDQVYCNVCDASDAPNIKIPYATKLLFQTLLGMNVATRILPIDRDEK